jgi:hypothetical protein
MPGEWRSVETETLARHWSRFVKCHHGLPDMFFSTPAK